MIYRERWQRQWWVALFLYVRDCFILLLPCRLPVFLRKLFFGFDPKFVFLVHSRREEDIFVALPFLKILKFLLPKRMRYGIFQAMPPFVLGSVRTKAGINGLVITTLKMPDYLLRHRRKAAKEAYRCVWLASRTMSADSYMGLGGWWPMVTKRGLVVNQFAGRFGIAVTNGHCGTLCSISMTIGKIAQLSKLSLREMDILILGVGKMGSNIARVLCGTVRRIFIYDRNAGKLRRVEEELKYLCQGFEVQSEVVPVPFDEQSLRQALTGTHLCVCAASNLGQILNSKELPNDVLIIDDSRPEAFPRILDQERNVAVLEGGLLKIPDSKIDYDFGFGKGDDTFGCLVEAYMLACDRGFRLAPTLGDVDMRNLGSMLELLETYGVSQANLWCSSLKVSDEMISDILARKRSSSWVSTTC